MGWQVFLQEDGWFVINIWGDDIFHGKRFSTGFIINRNLFVVEDSECRRFCVDGNGEDLCNGQRFTDLGDPSGVGHIISEKGLQFTYSPVRDSGMRENEYDICEGQYFGNSDKLTLITDRSGSYHNNCRGEVSSA